MMQLPPALPAMRPLSPVGAGRLSPSRIAPYGSAAPGFVPGPPRAVSPSRAVSPARVSVSPRPRATSARPRPSRIGAAGFEQVPEGVPCPPGTVLVANGRVRECHPAALDKRTKAYKEAHGLPTGKGARGPRAPSAGRAPRAPRAPSAARARTPRVPVQTIAYSGGAPNVNAKYHARSALPEVAGYQRWCNRYACGYKPKAEDLRTLGHGRSAAAAARGASPRARSRSPSPRR